jgi:hypothetical protein
MKTRSPTLPSPTAEWWVALRQNRSVQATGRAGQSHRVIAGEESPPGSCRVSSPPTASLNADSSGCPRDCGGPPADPQMNKAASEAIFTSLSL